MSSMMQAMTRRLQPLAQRALLNVQPLARDCDEALDFGHAEQLRERARPARTLDPQRRVVAPPALRVKKFVKLTDRRQAARQRCGAELLRAARGKETAHMRRVRLQRVGALGLQIGFVVGQIPPVGIERVHARAALGGKRLEEIEDV